MVRRALTGAWIETKICTLSTTSRRSSRALTGAWIETRLEHQLASRQVRRALTGAWIETIARFNRNIDRKPSRPHGRVD